MPDALPHPALAGRRPRRPLEIAVRGGLLALGTLRSHKVRSLLTLNGIVLGVTAIVVMTSALSTLDGFVRQNVFEHGAGVFRAQRESRESNATSEAELSPRRPFTDDDVRLLRAQLQSVDEVGGEMWSWGNRVASATAQTEPESPLVGAGEGFLAVNNLHLGAGRGLSPLDDGHARTVALIGAHLADRLFGSAARAVGQEIQAKGRAFTVVGVLAPLQAVGRADPRNTIVVVPLSTFERAFGFRSLYLVMRARDPSKVDEAQQEALVRLRALRGIAPGAPDDFVIASNADLESLVKGISIALGAASGFAAFLALLIGGVGLMNVTLVSVVQRTKEIGVRKAIGARPADIFLQFLFEAITLAGVGGALGTLLATLLVKGLGAALGVNAAVPLGALALALTATALTGLVSGTYPAMRAARLAPVDSLRGG